jgi:hypothetical protein
MSLHILGVVANFLIKTFEQPEGQRWEYFVDLFFADCVTEALKGSSVFGGVWLQELTGMPCRELICPRAGGGQLSR